MFGRMACEAGRGRVGESGGCSLIWSCNAVRMQFLIPPGEQLVSVSGAGFQALFNDGANYLGELLGCFDARRMARFKHHKS